MSIADNTALITAATDLMGASATLVSDEGQEGAATQTLNELGWPLPQTETLKCYWLVERCRRHIVYQLMVEQAHKFRVKQLHLQQRFDNYIRMIQKMDEVFAKAMESDVSGLFYVDVDLSAFAQYALMNIPADFVYDQLGRDLTYLVE